MAHRFAAARAERALRLGRRGATHPPALLGIFSIPDLFLDVRRIVKALAHPKGWKSTASTGSTFKCRRSVRCRTDCVMPDRSTPELWIYLRRRRKGTRVAIRKDPMGQIVIDRYHRPGPNPGRSALSFDVPSPKIRPRRAG